MDLDRLSDFLAIAKYGSISKAAQEIGTSRATLSARLKKFEDSLGAKLFERSSDSMILTAKGEQLLSSAEQISNMYRRLLHDAVSAQEHSYRSLRIAISGSNLPLHLGPFLDELNRNNPGIVIELLDDTGYSITDGIQSGTVDVYFAPSMNDFAPKGIVKQHLSDSTQFVVMPKNHPLAVKSIVNIRELEREQFILYPKTAESSIRDFQLRNLQDSGIHFTLYDEESSALFYKLLVPIGKGLLLRPSPMIDVPPNAVCIPVSGLPHPAPMCLFYDKSTDKSDVLAFVRDFKNFGKGGMFNDYRKTV